jgi:glycerol-3-phosphate dehydrogenase (NAD(P)+)
MEVCLKDADIIIFCCTSQSLRQVALQAAISLEKLNRADDNLPCLVSAIKGLEISTLKRMSEVLASILPNYPICVLSGPNLAEEVLQGLPSAAAIACEDLHAAQHVQSRLNSPTFRLYTNTDVVGVELGGALKNVIAIAAGCSDGLKLGVNAKSALLTRGLAEMSRFAQLMGAQPLTLAGLAGMGDLIATCAGMQSRNYRLGYALAQGGTTSDVLAGLGAVAEGVTTTRAVLDIAQQKELELPIAQQVKEMLQGTKSIKEAIETLMKRPLSSE